MDRQKFSRLVLEKLSPLNPNSVTCLDEGDDTVTIEVVSDEFRGESLLKRIKKVYSLIESCVQKADWHVSISPLTLEEKEGQSDQEGAKVRPCSTRLRDGRVADASH